MNIKKKTYQKLFNKQFSVFLSILPIFNLGFFSFNNFNLEPENTQSNEYFQYEESTNSQNMFILEAANHTDPNPSKGGGDINIIDESVLASESGVLGTSFDIEKASHTGNISTYQVREGDTLSEIAEMYNVSVNTIRWANDFEGPITPGQSLVILPVTGITHVVKHGGYIQDVADIYEADIDEIALFNGLDSSIALKPGDEIIVPNVDLSHDKNSSNNIIAKKINSNQSGSINSRSYFINPVPGGVITQQLHGYNSIDIADNYGTPIYASASGKVITSKQGGWNGGYGNYIVISHANGTQTLYSHNSENLVYVGQNVNKGDLIAKMGSTGRSTGNHLHFEVRGATNPLTSCSYRSVCK